MLADRAHRAIDIAGMQSRIDIGPVVLKHPGDFQPLVFEVTEVLCNVGGRKPEPVGIGAVDEVPGVGGRPAQHDHGNAQNGLGTETKQLAIRFFISVSPMFSNGGDVIYYLFSGPTC